MTQDELIKSLLEASQKFNDRTLQVVGWIGGSVFALITVVAGFTVFNLNSERDRLDRASSSMEEKFAKLSAELRGQRLDVPRLEILSQSDKLPLAGRPLGTPVIRQATDLASKPYRLTLQYTLRNSGGGSLGKLWTKIYFENGELFGGEPNPDEAGYGVATHFPHTSWTGSFSGTNGDFPGGGFSTNIDSNVEILKDALPKGRYKVLIKVYYGYPETRLERVETYFELFSDWKRPK